VRDDAGHELHQEHGCVDAENDAENASLVFVDGANLTTVIHAR